MAVSSDNVGTVCNGTFVTSRLDARKGGKMKYLHYLFVAFALFGLVGCSIAPERLATKKDLFNTGLYNTYIIKESPESVLAALNNDGEVVLESKYKDRPVYIKMLVTKQGIKFSVMER